MKQGIIARGFMQMGFASAALALITGAACAQSLTPGKGVVVVPVQTAQQEEAFQTRVVIQGLKDLGYDVKRTSEVEYATAHVAVANGDGTFMAAQWQPLQDPFYQSAGGDEKLVRKGVITSNALQGYLIDKKTADKYKITNIAQLKDPAIAKLFDADGDGKADLAGCTPGWGCEKAIEYQLDAYKLRATVTHKQGSYAALMADVFTRYKEGKPILYYTWTPYYVSSVLAPGKDVVWLEVPFSAQPANLDTKLPNGKDYGFVINKQNIVANKKFVKDNPAAGKLFEVMQLPIGDISAQNLRMSKGENKPADIERHANGWIKAHQKTFDGWIAQAQAAAKK